MEDRRFQTFMVLQLLLLSLQAHFYSVQAQEEAFLIFANRDDSTEGITMTNLDGTNSKRLVTSMTASGLDYDFRDKTLFWSDIESETIYKAALNGSSPKVIVNDTSDPENIGWDWINKKLYWTDVTRGTLEVMDVETGYRKVLISMGRDAQIRGLQLDPINRWMYWTTIAPNGGGMIAKTSMDGAGTMVLHDSSIVEFPNGLTLDETSSTLYWVDAGSDKKNIVGKSLTTLSSPNMTVFRFSTRQIPFHTTYYNGGLYFTEWIGRSVSRLDLDSTPSVQELVDTNDRLGMIRVIAASKQPSFFNPCADAGVQCSQLCLLSTTDPRGYSCACTDGVELNADRHTCGPVAVTTPPTVPTVPVATSDPIIVPNGLCGTTIQCDNGGTCVDTTPNQFICRCREGYSGTFCEILPATENPSFPDDNIVLIYVLSILGIMAFMIIVSLALVLFACWMIKTRNKQNHKHHEKSSMDGLSMSSRDSHAHFVLVNGRMSEHDYMSIKSRGNSPAPSRILICNVGEQGPGTIPNNYIYEQPYLVPLPTNGSQTLDHLFSTQRTPPPEPIYNTVKSTKTQTL
ncbi:low-density lipoprotein receptor-related protein 4-like isoform X2 [Halichondria panicea]|uniref:low-density lipoprotein receptor-related protein 4-like isoform X2 n=1 Tax=Halichondria panicea TaxID=6063 RepID=UPI00312B5A03